MRNPVAVLSACVQHVEDFGMVRVEAADEYYYTQNEVSDSATKPTIHTHSPSFLPMVSLGFPTHALRLFTSRISSVIPTIHMPYYYNCWFNIEKESNGSV